MGSKFVEKITNEEVACLPCISFRGKVVVVDRPEMIAAACDDLLSREFIGFDTETRPTFRPGALNKISLLQLATPECCYLFRLCKIPFDSKILKVLESRKVVKIGADVSNDLRALKELKQFRTGTFIDLQSIVSQWGIGEKSVRKMAGIVLGTKVSKAQRLSNWEAGKLTPAQISYAATDAWVCLRIYNELVMVPCLTGEPPVLPDRIEITAKKTKKRKPRNIMRGKTETKTDARGAQDNTEER